MKNRIHHIALTVSNAKRSTDFYQKALGWKIVEQKDDYSYLVPNEPGTKFILVIGEPRDRRIHNDAFDQNRIGLDHFALDVDSEEELKAIEGRLKKFGIEMEAGGITDDGFDGTAIFCRDPDGMKVEFHLSK